jgi:hypothetical protein
VNVECRCCEKSVDETTAVQLLHAADVKICFDCLGWLDAQRDRRVQAHSGGWVCTFHDHIFVVADVAQASEHYRRLGFDVEPYDEGYAFASRGDTLNIHLEAAEGAGRHAGQGIVYLHCDDADVVVEEWRKAGLEVTAPEDKPWGKYEGSHVDPDGNLIRFGSPRRGRRQHEGATE